jgi:hypothetical protein
MHNLREIILPRSHATASFTSSFANATALFFSLTAAEAFP